MSWHGETSAFQVHMQAMEEAPEMDCWGAMKMRHCFKPGEHH